MQVQPLSGGWGNCRDPGTGKLLEGSHGIVDVPDRDLAGFAGQVIERFGSLTLKRRVVFYPDARNAREPLPDGDIYGIVEQDRPELIRAVHEPEWAGVTFSHTEDNASGGTYHVYRANDGETALEFLRQNPVKEPVTYRIVETPLGNIGADYLAIFREADGATIEPVERHPSAVPQPSPTHCAWCGFYVRPYELPEMTRDTARGIASVSLALTWDELNQLMERGHGYRCPSCQLLHCAPCSGFVDASQTPSPSCRGCGARLDIYKAFRFSN
jgi:hypothetical protein